MNEIDTYLPAFLSPATYNIMANIHTNKQTQYEESITNNALSFPKFTRKFFIIPII